MPVDLSRLSPEATPNARPPHPVAWLLLAMIVIGGGCALVLWLWPKDISTHDWRFWTWIGAVPILVYALIFAVRWHWYEQALAPVEAYNRQRDGVVEHNTRFAQRPLVLLAYAYVTAMGEQHVARRIFHGESALEFQPVRGIGVSVNHTGIVSQRQQDREPEKRRTRRDAMPLTDDDLLEVFGRLIKRMQPTLAALPPQLVLPIRLVVTGNEYPLDIARQWETAWHAFGLGKFMFREPPSEHPGLMALDTWLDETDPLERNRIELYVNVQFRDDPPDNGAEAATAMLIAWPDIVDRLKLPAMARLHRPVGSPAEHFESAFAAALTWGSVTSVAETHAWASGLDTGGRTCLARSFRPTSPQAAAVDNDSHSAATANIDVSLGNAGHTAGWLACALAVEHFQAADEPQLIATQEPGGVVYAVVRKPPPRQLENTPLS